MNSPFLTGSFLKKIFFTVTISLCYCMVFAQSDKSQNLITAAAAQAIQFGAFCITGGAGGTITVAYDGNRTCTGDIVLLPANPIAVPAIFELKFCPGKNVTINFDAATTVYGTHGPTLKMDIGPTEKGLRGYTFTTDTDCNAVTSLRVGGTLHIPGNTRPGNYSATFTITFKQE